MHACILHCISCCLFGIVYFTVTNLALWQYVGPTTKQQGLLTEILSCSRSTQSNDAFRGHVRQRRDLNGSSEKRTVGAHFSVKCLRHEHFHCNTRLYSQGRIKTKLDLMLQQWRRVDYAKGRTRLFPLSPLPLPLSFFFPFLFPSPLSP